MDPNKIRREIDRLIRYLESEISNELKRITLYDLFSKIVTRQPREIAPGQHITTNCVEVYPDGDTVVFVVEGKVEAKYHGYVAHTKCGDVYIPMIRERREVVEKNNVTLIRFWI